MLHLSHIPIHELPAYISSSSLPDILSNFDYVERRIFNLDFVDFIQLKKLLLWHGDSGSAAPLRIVLVRRVRKTGSLFQELHCSDREGASSV